MADFEFEPYLGWQNVIDPENPQPGAKRITKDDLLRYERGLEDAEQAIKGVYAEIPVAINSNLSSVTEALGGSAIWPDLTTDGLYLFRQGGQLVESDVPGLYVIQPDIPVMPNFEIPSGVMIAVNEVGGTYTRPTDSPHIVCVFTGVSDPGAVALENDRWEKLP